MNTCDKPANWGQRAWDEYQVVQRHLRKERMAPRDSEIADLEELIRD